MIQLHWFLNQSAFSTLCSSSLLHFILHIYSTLIFFMWIWKNSSYFYSGIPFFLLCWSISLVVTKISVNTNVSNLPLPLLQHFWIACLSLGISRWLYLQCLHFSKWISMLFCDKELFNSDGTDGQHWFQKSGLKVYQTTWFVWLSGKLIQCYKIYYSESIKVGKHGFSLYSSQWKYIEFQL